MCCCNKKYYELAIGEEGEFYFKAILANYCPICGTPIPEH